MRTDTLFGKNVNIVGDISADLVLESLGKIYIKSRNKAQTLDEIIKSLGTGSVLELAQLTVIIDSLADLDEMIIKDGTLVYDKNSGTLYILIDGELLELISVSKNDTRYVKKTGDTMTGLLAIQTKTGRPPLIVTSSSLNKNFNAQYLNGLPSSAFAQKAKDEKITGSWSFENNTYFNAPTYFSDNTIHYKDAIHVGSIGTPSFASGFGGYGWRMDATTNTLTLDYIVVRKAMFVYELVVNKIRATNGSLWVSNSSKITSVCRLKLIYGDNSYIWNSFSSPSDEHPENSTNVSEVDREVYNTLRGLRLNDGVIVTNTTLSTRVLTPEENSNNLNVGETRELFDFSGLSVIMCKDPEKVVTLGTKLRNNGLEFHFTKVECDNPTVGEVFSGYDLYDEDFDKEVVFPVVHFLNTNYKYDNEGKSPTSIYGSPKYIKSYYKYFGQDSTNFTKILTTNFYLVLFDTDNLPVFLPGDLLRCLKFTGNGIKYYDAVVCNKLKESYYIILLAPGILDTTTYIEYDDNLQPTTTTEISKLNEDFYNRTAHGSDDILGIVLEGDDIVLIGHLWDVTRQNALYLTSSDDGAPFMDIMSEVNRPDYSVIYYTPTFESIKLYRGGVLPFTGKYYLLQETENGIHTALYAIAYKDDTSTFSIELNTKYQTQIIAAYMNENGSGTIEFDAIFDLTQEELNDILSNITEIREVLIPGTASPVYSILDVKNLFVRKFTEIQVTDIDDYTIKILRGYPNLYTLLIQTRETESIVAEDGLEFEINELEVETTNDCTINENIFIIEEVKTTNSVASTRTTKARIGRLDGIIDERFGVRKQPHGYGLYGENVYLTGEFILSNGKNVLEIDKDIISLQSGLEMNSLAYLRLMDRLLFLADNTPSYGNLEAAGIFLTENKLILYGDSIQIITNHDELNGYDMPTALFADGKIQAKFLAIYEVRNLIPIYGSNDYGTGIGTIPNESVTIRYEDTNYTFTATGDLFIYKEPLGGKKYKNHYVRKFVNGTRECWIYCGIDGKIIYTTTYGYRLADSDYCAPDGPLNYETVYSNPLTDTYVTDTDSLFVKYNDNFYRKTSTSTFLYVTFTNYKETTPSTYTWDIATMLEANKETEYEEDGETPLINVTKNAYLYYYNDHLEQTGLWSLNYDGSGNLGGSGIHWDTEGKLTVTGIINATSGRIGGLSIAQNWLYRNMTCSDLEVPVMYLGSASEWGDPYLELTSWNYSATGCLGNPTVKSKSILGTGGLTIYNGDTVNDASNVVQISPNGVTWKNGPVAFESIAALFSITVIPVKGTANNGNIFLPYVKINYPCVLSSNFLLGSVLESPFRYVNIYMWHGEDSNFGSNRGGRYIIYFPELDDTTLGPQNKAKTWAKWMCEAVKSGKVTFQITGLGELSTNRDFTLGTGYANYLKDMLLYPINFYLDSVNDNNPLPLKASIHSYSFGCPGYRLNLDEYNNIIEAGGEGSIDASTGGGLHVGHLRQNYNVCYFHRPYDRSDTIIYNNDVNVQGNRLIWSVKGTANSEDSLYTYYKKSDSTLKRKLRDLRLFGSYTDEADDLTSVYKDELPSSLRHIQNFIKIITSDDDSLNSGGFMLTAFYSNNSSLYNSNYEGIVHTEVSEE